jgi:hypothetical protein
VAPAEQPPDPAPAPQQQSGSWDFLQGPATTDSGGGLTPEQLAYGKDAYGNPYQSLRNVPANDPVGQATGQDIRTNQVPGLTTQAIGSLPTDPEQRRRVIAGQLFPDMEPAEAQSRIFYGVNGRLAAVGKDGVPFYVEPEPYAPDINDPTSLVPRDNMATLGTLAGPALPAIGGVAGGAIAGPASLIAGPVVAGVGAGAGDVARQALAAHFDPQPGFHYNPAQTATEVAGAVTGQAAGAGLLRLIAPNRLGASALDIGNLRSGPTMANANRLSDLAASQGVQLTPGQASGLPSLLAHEDAIASGSAGPGLADVAASYYTSQRNQLLAAGQAALDRISPVADKTDAAMQFQQGAEDATRLVRQNANAAARPSYDAAQAGGQVMSPDLAQLSELPAVKDALNAAATDYHNLTGNAANTNAPDFQLWNLAKTKLDDAVNTAQMAGQNTSAMALDTIRQRLLTNLDAAYPSYADARATAAPGQRLAARMQTSLGPAGTGTETAQNVMNPVFNSNNPRAIAEQRDAFNSAGRGDEWNAGTRAYLQNQFDNASKSIDGLNPAMLRRQIWGNQDVKDKMQAAMDPQQFQGLNNFMDTVERVAQSRGMNSLTAPRGAAVQALNDAAGNTAGVKGFNAAGTILTPSVKGGLFGIPGEWSRSIGSYLQGRNLKNISERLFSPEGMEYLRQMGNLSQGSQRAISATSEFLGQTGARQGVPGGRQSLPQPLQNALMMP